MTERSEQSRLGQWGGLPASVVVVLAVLALQTVVLVVVLGWLIVEFFVDSPESLSTALFLTVIVAMGVAFWAATFVGILRRSVRSRGAAVFCQLLALAMGVGSAQGVDAQWGIAVALVVPALAAGLTVVMSNRFARYLGVDDNSRSRP